MESARLWTWGLSAVFLALLAVLGWRLRRPAFLALLVSLFLASVAGELALRSLGVGVPTRPEWVEPLTGDLAGPAYRPGGTLYYRYPTDPRGYFDADGAVVGHVNALGLRGAECALAKAPGTRRVAVLGDSFTLGIGVRDEDTLPAQLQRALGRADVEVLNFGVSATQTVEHVRYLEGYALGFDPDVVVLVYFLNDAERDSTIEYMTVPRAFAALRRHSKRSSRKRISTCSSRPVVAPSASRSANTSISSIPSPGVVSRRTTWIPALLGSHPAVRSLCRIMAMQVRASDCTATAICWDLLMRELWMMSPREAAMTIKRMVIPTSISTRLNPR